MNVTTVLCNVNGILPCISGKHSYASSGSYASIDSRDQDSLYDEYVPPPMPPQVMTLSYLLKMHPEGSAKASGNAYSAFNY